MIFNNAHEDCKKLTPEVVNTESGKYLHQFEWTDKVSMIPERWFITEGTDTLKQNQEHTLYILQDNNSLDRRYEYGANKYVRR